MRVDVVDGGCARREDGQDLGAANSGGEGQWLTAVTGGSRWLTAEAEGN